MVSAAKAFEKEPPKEPLSNLEAITRDFKWRYVDRLKTDQVVKFCAEAPDFATAVRRAVEARDANGKHHNHQSKVDITARRKFGATIIRIALRGGVDMTDFDAMHDRFNEHKPYRIGPVTLYDTCIRIAAYLGIEPESVYTHAGVRQGVKALHAAMVRGGEEPLFDPKDDRIALHLFPEPWDTLPADDIEDMLCTYREVFEGWNK